MWACRTLRTSAPTSSDLARRERRRGLHPAGWVDTRLGFDHIYRLWAGVHPASAPLGRRVVRYGRAQGSPTKLRRAKFRRDHGFHGACLGPRHVNPAIFKPFGRSNCQSTAARRLVRNPCPCARLAGPVRSTCSESAMRQSRHIWRSSRRRRQLLRPAQPLRGPPLLGDFEVLYGCNAALLALVIGNAASVATLVAAMLAPESMAWTLSLAASSLREILTRTARKVPTARRALARHEVRRKLAVAHPSCPRRRARAGVLALVGWH